MPIDEIERPIIELGNQTLFYSTAFLVFVLPLYVTLIVISIDRRLGRNRPPVPARRLRVVSKGFFGEPDPIPSRSCGN